jgi:hypothetical protein
MIVGGIHSDEQRCAQVQAACEPLPNYCLEHYSLELRGNPALGPQDVRTWAAAHADLDRLADKFPQSSLGGDLIHRGGRTYRLEWRSFQRLVAEWILTTLGEESATNGAERVLRLVEEAVELAQACGVDAATVHRLVDYVFERPVGDPPKEIAGCMVTLYGAASALGVDADEEFRKELLRIQQPEVVERVRRRQQEKRAAIKAG